MPLDGDVGRARIAGRVVAMMVLDEAGIGHLYVDPPWHSRGIGSRLVELAKERRPGGLELYTFQVNKRARRFYEWHGFVGRDARRRLGQRGAPTGRALPLAAVTAVPSGASPRPTARRSRSFPPATGRRSSSFTARPPTTRRGGPWTACSSARSGSMPSTGAAAGRPAMGRPTRSSASSRTSPRSPTRWPPRPARPSTSSATRTAGDVRSGPRC